MIEVRQLESGNQYAMCLDCDLPITLTLLKTLAEDGNDSGILNQAFQTIIVQHISIHQLSRLMDTEPYFM